MDISIITVNSENVLEYGVCCVVNRKSPGFNAKINWFKDITNRGVTLVVAIEPGSKKQLGFVEITDSELAWRPVNSENNLFIHCITVFSKSTRKQSIGSKLLEYCEEIAKSRNKDGLCAMTSSGTWMANKTLFENNGFFVVEKADRFELMYKSLNDQSVAPKFNDWTAELPKYQGWNLLYADQCPWHIKSVNDLQDHARESGINLKITKLTTPIEAQKAPSGYGTFALIKDGKLLTDHYISKTRFKNILKAELN